ncbi:unnamed protein product [Mytilus coruscus]|uniref:WSC domain-containing protein n=1 Tax=Mytilus coruscus TaxID=42192 RepID=A0A6J8CGL8_MYTCO|nr:unnamed protein product [Mytilus coruscus]
MSKQFLMICMETLVIIVLYSVKIKCNRLETGIAEFKNADTLCSPGYQLAGKGVFDGCQPENCGKIDFEGHKINRSKVKDITQILWIDAYVGYICYCIKSQKLKNWKADGKMDEVSTGECSDDCPGEKMIVAEIPTLKLCLHINSRVIITMVKWERKVLTKQCYQILFNWYQAERKCLRDGNYLPTYTPSNDKCNSERTGVDNVNNWHNTFVRERIVWETVNKPRFNYKCLAIKLRKDKNYTLLAVDCTDKYKALCVRKSTTESTTHLNGQQETTNPGDTAETKSESTTQLNGQQETTNPEDTAKTTTVSSDRLSRAVDMQNPTSKNPKVELYIAVLLTVAVLIVSVIITVICIKRRRRRKTDKNARNMSTVYYSTVPDEVTLEKASDNPHGDGNGACLLNETDVYNHLGDTDQLNHSDLTGPVYDHTGLKDNDQYDISIISEKRINKDGDDFNHYDLMQVSTDNNSVYDETKRKTNGDKNIVSVEINDHAKQTENDYDTTDTQRQHETCKHLNDPTYEQSGPCDHLNDPMYDQSGPCDHLNDPMYDQSGPCEHLNDPTYDQSGPLEAAIFEKCETKQSNTEEQ